MFKHIKSFFKENIFPILIALVVSVISVANYVPGTTLTGWDNLHSEFNLPLNIARSISAVWQEYQGVGLVGGMAHAADLSREILLFLASPIIPMQVMRYFWTFSMLFLGPFGAYYLLHFVARGKKVGAFVGALFYLLNLATVQYFYTPYESFISFYGFLPWFILSALFYLEVPSKKRGMLLLLTFLLGSSAFYVQTLFVVFLMILTLFVIEYMVRHKKHRVVASLVGLIFAASAYWLLPVAYFSLTKVSVVSESRINSIATIETQYMTQSFGDLPHMARLQGFWFEYIDTQDGKYDFLMKSWREYMSEPLVESVAVLLFVLSSIGMIAGVFIRKKLRYAAAPAAIFVMCLIMLSGGNGFFGGVFDVLSNKVPLFGQLFRSSFTKWSPVAALFYGWGLSTLFVLLGQLLHKRTLLNRLVVALFAVVAIALMSYVVVPVFKGDLISNNMRLVFPKEYTDLFSYFSEEPAESRIAFMPAQSFWSWNFYDWGYRGSGFLWYGLKQPILDRAFDVWSTENEGFYSEIETAVYRNESELVRRVLTKYRVRYVLLDQSVLLPQSTSDALKFEETQKLLASAGWVKSWEESKLSVYKNENINHSFVEATGAVHIDGTNNTPVAEDVSIIQGDYIASSESKTLFPKLLAQQFSSGEYKTDQDGAEYLEVRTPVDTSSATHQVIIPGINIAFEVSGTVEYKNRTLTVNFNDPAVIVGGAEMKPVLKPLFIETNKKYDKVGLSFGEKVVTLRQGEKVRFNGVPVQVDKDLPLYVFDLDTRLSVSIATQMDAPFNRCWEREENKGAFDVSRQGSTLSLKTNDVVACSSYKVGSFPGNKSLLHISLPFKSPNRARPDFCLVQEGDARCLHDEIFYSETTSTEWRDVNREIFIDGDKTYWIVLSARPSDTPHEDWTIDYQIPQISVVNAVGAFTVKRSYWEELRRERVVALSPNTTEVVTRIPLSNYEIDITASGRGGAYNCDLFKRGSVGRTIDGSVVQFEATDRATECDYRLLKDLNLSSDYLLRFSGQNVEGRSLKVYVFNQRTQRNDVEVLLPRGNFDKTILLPYSALHPEKIDKYTLNFESRSFGDRTVNRLDSVKAYSAPFVWLAGWSVDAQEKPLFAESVYSGSSKIGTWFYRGVLESRSNGGSTVVSLSQGYNPGWILFSKGIFAPVRFNSWANGWIIPNVEGTQTVTIIYVPQIVEFIGFALIAVAAILRLGLTRKNI